MAETGSLPTSLTLEIVTPDRSLVTADVEEVQIPGTMGYFGVLPGHTPLLSTLAIGDLWYRKGRDVFHLSVAGGFAEVLPDKVTILAQIAERAEEIDVARAQRARQRAEERLRNPPPDFDPDRAQASFLRATVRLQVAALAGAPMGRTNANVGDGRVP
jgi:F-type H+-transporting ATPase subunit epsilon